MGGQGMGGRRGRAEKGGEERLDAGVRGEEGRRRGGT